MVLKRSCPAVSLQEEKKKKTASARRRSGIDPVIDHSPDLQFDFLPVQLDGPDLKVDP